MKRRSRSRPGSASTRSPLTPTRGLVGTVEVRPFCEQKCSIVSPSIEQTRAINSRSPSSPTTHNHSTQQSHRPESESNANSIPLRPLVRPTTATDTRTSHASNTYTFHSGSNASGRTDTRSNGAEADPYRTIDSDSDDDIIEFPRYTSNNSNQRDHHNIISRNSQPITHSINATTGPRRPLSAVSAQSSSSAIGVSSRPSQSQPQSTLPSYARPTTNSALRSARPEVSGRTREWITVRQAMGGLLKNKKTVEATLTRIHDLCQQQYGSVEYALAGFARADPTQLSYEELEGGLKQLGDGVSNLDIKLITCLCDRSGTGVVPVGNFFSALTSIEGAKRDPITHTSAANRTRKSDWEKSNPAIRHAEAKRYCFSGDDGGKQSGLVLEDLDSLSSSDSEPSLFSSRTSLHSQTSFTNTNNNNNNSSRTKYNQDNRQSGSSSIPTIDLKGQQQTHHTNPSTPLSLDRQSSSSSINQHTPKQTVRPPSARSPPTPLSTQNTASQPSLEPRRTLSRPTSASGNMNQTQSSNRSGWKADCEPRSPGGHALAVTAFMVMNREMERKNAEEEEPRSHNARQKERPPSVREIIHAGEPVYEPADEVKKQQRANRIRKMSEGRKERKQAIDSELDTWERREQAVEAVLFQKIDYEQRIKSPTFNHSWSLNEEMIKERKGPMKYKTTASNVAVPFW